MSFPTTFYRSARRSADTFLHTQRWGPPVRGHEVGPGSSPRHGCNYQGKLKGWARQGREDWDAEEVSGQGWGCQNPRAKKKKKKRLPGSRVGMLFPETWTARVWAANPPPERTLMAPDGQRGQRRVRRGWIL